LFVNAFNIYKFFLKKKEKAKSLDKKCSQTNLILLCQQILIFTSIVKVE